jgi:tRNA pseudouridine38-40 synthase
VRYRLTIEYAGTKYSGWQIQQNARTVQGELQRAAAQALGTAIEIQGSGRTDAGVHALGQVAHLETTGDLPPETLRRRINDELPADINVLTAARAKPRFHARHDAVARSYIYQIARRRTAFAKPFVWWVKDSLDVARMRDAATFFVGFHDFRSFTDDDPDQKSTRVQLDGLEIFEDEDLLVVHMEGSHFLWKMVRRIVGVLVEVGRGGMSRADARALLDEPSPIVAKLTAPASGLFLERVFYRDDPRDAPVRAAVRVGTALGSRL